MTSLTRHICPTEKKEEIKNKYPLHFQNLHHHQPWDIFLNFSRPSKHSFSNFQVFRDHRKENPVFVSGNQIRPQTELKHHMTLVLHSLPWTQGGMWQQGLQTSTGPSRSVSLSSRHVKTGGRGWSCLPSAAMDGVSCPELNIALKICAFRSGASEERTPTTNPSKQARPIRLAKLYFTQND